MISRLLLLATLLPSSAFSELIPVGPRWIPNAPEEGQLSLSGNYFVSIPNGSSFGAKQYWPVSEGFSSEPRTISEEPGSNSSLHTTYNSELFLSERISPNEHFRSVDFESGTVKLEFIESDEFHADYRFDALVTPTSFWSSLVYKEEDRLVIPNSITRLDRTDGSIELYEFPTIGIEGNIAVSPDDRHLAMTYVDNTAELGQRCFLKVIDLDSRAQTKILQYDVGFRSDQPLVRNGVVAILPTQLGTYHPPASAAVRIYQANGTASATIPFIVDSEPNESVTFVPTHDGFWFVRSGEDGGKIRHVKLGGDQLYEIDFYGDVPTSMRVFPGVSDRYLAVREDFSGPIGVFDRHTPTQLSIQASEAHENSGSIDVRVRLSKALDVPASCRLVSDSGTATQGVDFLALNQLLTFPPGTTEQSARITILDDTVPELHETIQLSLVECEGATWDERPSPAIIRASGVLYKPRFEQRNFPADFNMPDRYEGLLPPLFSNVDINIANIGNSSIGQTRLAVFDARENLFQCVLEVPSNGFTVDHWWSDDQRISGFSKTGRYLSWSRSSGALLDDIPWPDLPTGNSEVPNTLAPTATPELLLLGNPNEGFFEVNALNGARRAFSSVNEFAEFSGQYSLYSSKPAYLGYTGSNYWLLAWMKPSEGFGAAKSEFQLRSYDKSTLELLGARTLRTFVYPESGTGLARPAIPVYPCGSHVIVGEVCYDTSRLQALWSIADLREKLSRVAGFDIRTPNIQPVGNFFVAQGSSNYPRPLQPAYLIDPASLCLLEQLQPNMGIPQSSIPLFGGQVIYGTELTYSFKNQTDPWTAGWNESRQLSVDRRSPAVDVTATPTITPYGLTLEWTAIENYDQPLELTWKVLETEHPDFVDPYDSSLPQVPDFFESPEGSAPISGSSGAINLVMQPSSWNWPDDFSIEIESGPRTAEQASRPAKLSSHVVEAGDSPAQMTFSGPVIDPSHITIDHIEISDRWLASLIPSAYENGQTVGRIDIFERSSGQFFRSLTRPPSAKWETFGQLARIHGDRILVGSPTWGNSGRPEPNSGEVFLFDIPTGQLLHTFPSSLGIIGFGFALAMNDQYIAIGAMGEDPDISKLNPLQRGGFEVFNATTYQSIWKKRTYAEQLGASLVLRGDQIFSGAPYASPVYEGQKLYYIGTIHQFDIPRKQLVETFFSPSPVQYSGFGRNLQVTDRHLAAEARLFYQFSDQTWYALDSGSDRVPLLKGEPVLGGNHLSSAYSSKLEIFNLDTGRIHIGGAGELFSRVTLSDDGWVYWANGSTAYGMEISLIEGFSSWSDAEGKTTADFDEYLEKIGATFSLKIDPNQSDPLLTDLLPDLQIPVDAEAVIEKSTDLRSWSPAFRRDVTGNWLPASDDTSDRSCEFYRLNIGLNPLFTPPEAP